MKLKKCTRLLSLGTKRLGFVKNGGYAYVCVGMHECSSKPEHSSLQPSQNHEHECRFRAQMKLFRRGIGNIYGQEEHASTFSTSVTGC